MQKLLLSIVHILVNINLNHIMTCLINVDFFSPQRRNLLYSPNNQVVWLVVSIGDDLVLGHAFLYFGISYQSALPPENCLFLCHGCSKIVHFSCSSFCAGVRYTLNSC